MSGCRACCGRAAPAGWPPAAAFPEAGCIQKRKNKIKKEIQSATVVDTQALQDIPIAHPMTMESSTPLVPLPSRGEAGHRHSYRTAHRGETATDCTARCWREGGSRGGDKKKIPSGPRPRLDGAQSCWDAKREKRGGGRAGRGEYTCCAAHPHQNLEYRVDRRVTVGRRAADQSAAPDWRNAWMQSTTSPSACRLSTLCAAGRWGQRAATHFRLGHTQCRERITPASCRSPAARARACPLSPPPPAFPSIS